MIKISVIYSLYQKLLKQLSDPVAIWPERCAIKKNEKLREIIAIGTILVQRTSWHNADIALRSLKNNNLLSIKKIAQLDNLTQLTQLIQPAGFYTTKPQRLVTLCKYIYGNFISIANMQNHSLVKIRTALLNLNGIGSETADTFCLYVLNKPTFIIDEYTKRFVKKYHLSKSTNPVYLKQLFEKSLPANYQIYQNYHVLIIADQKGIEHTRMYSLI